MKKLQRNLWRRIAAVAVAAALAGWADVNARPHPPRAALPAELPRLVRLPAGLTVGSGPPPGWSDLVVKSIPRVEPNALPAFARRTAELFRVVVLADVAADGPGSHRLARVGIGLAVPGTRGDVVVRPGADDPPGAALSALDRLVLGRASAEMDRGRLVARTPTFALYATPTRLVVDGEPRPACLRYALRVDPGSGRLDRAVWAVDEVGHLLRPDWVRLPPSLVFDAPLHVEPQCLPGGLTVGWSFAMADLPPGTARPLPPALRALAGSNPRTTAEAAALEQAVRAAFDPKAGRLSAGTSPSRRGSWRGS